MFLSTGLRSVNSIHVNWNADSQSLAWARSEAKMATHGGKSCTSVLVLFAVLYVGSSLAHDFNFQFLLSKASKTFTAAEKVFRRNITGPILQKREFRRIQNCCAA